MNSDTLKKHIFRTYFNLRIGLGAIALLFSILLIVIGLLKGIKIQESLSAYYHVDNLSRDIFVGILCTIGLFLYLYKGFTKSENWVLNLAGLFAICVALIPMTWAQGFATRKFSVHGFCAVALFLCMAYVCIFCASATLKLLNDPNKEKKFRLLYLIIGILMILTPLIAWVFTTISTHAFVLIAEVVCIAVFACYWLLKSYELSLSDAEYKVFSEKFEL